MEQERSTFREVLESHAGKRFDLSTLTYLCAHTFLDVLLYSVAIFVVEKATLEKRVKELEESLASKNTEAEKVATDVAAREAEFVNRAAFLTQNVRGKIFFVYFIHSNACIWFVLTFISFALTFVQKQHASQHLWIRRVAGCRSMRL